MINPIIGKWEGLDGMGVEALNELRPDAEHRVVQAGVLFTNELKITLTGQRHGRTYRISKTGRLHQASAPGEPPAVLYGALRNSVGFTKPVWDGWSVSVEVGVGLATSREGENPESYAARLEFGGIDSRGVRILRRPYMEPTSIRVEPMIDELFDRG